MANYAVDDFTESADTLSAVLALLETKLETITNTKTIRLMSVHKVGNKYAYALVVDA
jgi:hypoxanthine phosphoribosyltransferase|tara:strand:+ start:29 stop:199 length:171 start_codon:yes stop_codon:yes gene_type:complete